MLKTILNLFLILSSQALSAQTWQDTSLLISEHRVYFDSDQYLLEELEGKKVDSIILVGNQYDNSFYYLTGHTDDVGEEEYNKTLSRKRVETLEQKLLAQGVRSENIQANYFGEENPLADNTSANGRQLNRRATLALYLPKRLIPISGRIVDDENKEGVQGQVEMQSKDFNQTVQTDTSGNFKLMIPSNEKVTIDLSAAKYFFKSIEFNRDSTEVVNQITVPLSYLEEGKTFQMESLFFEGNLATFLEKSKPVLPRLGKMMKVNSDVCIEIAGHINLPNTLETKIGSYYHGLSIARSLEVYDYLLSENITTKRMVSKGYGNWRMIFPNAFNNREQAKNRRVEIKVRSCDSTAIAVNDTVWNRYEYQPLNDELIQKMNQVAEDDQKYRRQLKTVRRAHGDPSEEMDELWEKINRADSLNLIIVKKVLSEFGWISESRLFGKGRRAIFMVIQHADLITQKKYFPMLKEAVGRDAVSSSAEALLEDRILTREGKNQIYGTQLERNDQGVYQLLPIDDVDKLGSLRKEMGLNSIEQYLEQFGMDWEKEKLRLGN